MVQLSPQGNFFQDIFDFPLFDPILLILWFFQNVNILLLEELVEEKRRMGPQFQSQGGFAGGKRVAGQFCAGRGMGRGVRRVTG
jgi:hypothetical protein